MQLTNVSYRRLSGAHLSMGGGQFGANIQFMDIGTPVARVQGAAVNAQITFSVSGGTPTSGSARFTFFGRDLDVVFNETAATLKVKIDALLGSGNCVVTGGAWPGTGLVVEMVGNLAGLAPQTPSLQSHTLSAGTPAVAVTRAAVESGRFVRWDPTVIATPANNVSALTAAAGGAWDAGVYLVQFAWESAQGVTTPSSPIEWTSLGSEHLVVGAINAANTPDTATHLRVYVNGSQVARIAVATPGTGGNVTSTNVAPPAAGAGSEPVRTANTAFTTTNWRLAGFTAMGLNTNYLGQLFFASGPNPTGLERAGSADSTIIQGGIVTLADLLGLPAAQQAEAARQLDARELVNSAGAIDWAFGPYGNGGSN